MIPNTSDTTNILLERLIALQSNPNEAVVASPGRSPTSFQLTSVNGLWFAALACSLATALISMLAKQWLQAYVADISGSPLQRARQRQSRYTELVSWHVPALINALPLLLHVALLLFFAGIIVLLWSVNLATTLATLVITVFAYFFYLTSVLLPVVYPDCPYRHPLSEHIRKYFLSFHPSPQVPALAEDNVDNLTQNSNMLVTLEDKLDASALVWLLKTSTDKYVHSAALQAIAGLPRDFTALHTLREAGVITLLEQGFQSCFDQDKTVDLKWHLLDEESAYLYCKSWMSMSRRTSRQWPVHLLEPLWKLQDIEDHPDVAATASCAVALSSFDSHLAQWELLGYISRYVSGDIELSPSTLTWILDSMIAGLNQWAMALAVVEKTTISAVPVLLGLLKHIEDLPTSSVRSATGLALYGFTCGPVNVVDYLNEERRRNTHPTLMVKALAAIVSSPERFGVIDHLDVVAKELSRLASPMLSQPHRFSPEVRQTARASLFTLLLSEHISADRLPNDLLSDALHLLHQVRAPPPNHVAFVKVLSKILVASTHPGVTSWSVRLLRSLLTNCSLAVALAFTENNGFHAVLRAAMRGDIDNRRLQVDSWRAMHAFVDSCVTLQPASTPAIDYVDSPGDRLIQEIFRSDFFETIFAAIVSNNWSLFEVSGRWTPTLVQLCQLRSRDPAWTKLLRVVQDDLRGRESEGISDIIYQLGGVLDRPQSGDARRERMSSDNASKTYNSRKLGQRRRALTRTVKANLLPSMADLPSLLFASLNPSTRKQAEHSLDSVSVQPGFLTALLRLVLEPSQDRAVRLAGGVYLKNITKHRWEEDVQPLAEEDKAALRSQLVPAMLALSNPADRSIRAQVAEAVALIAELDFPTKWTNLIDQLVASLSATDYNVNVGVLETAHSIFRKWRAQVRSDSLFTEINLVLTAFVAPFLQLFRQTATLLQDPRSNPSVTTPIANYALLAQAMVHLNDIFYDFTCHDLPPALEDAHAEFFEPGKGWFQFFLSWNSAELKGDPDDSTPSLPSQIKTRILEIAELYIKLYPEQLQQSPAIESFVQSVWAQIGSNQLPGIADDGLVSQSLRFISTAIRSGQYKTLFSSQETISTLVQGVVVPNVSLREHDVEQFEDDPLEFIRLDLALSSAGTENATRRQAAADVLQALVSSGFETETTEIVGKWINTGLSEYESNKAQNWKAKDSAVYLLTALATRGSTSQSRKHGVTSTNTLVDVVKFFSEHVFQDLQAAQGTVHPILQVDAIRFLLTFRNQLTKPQLLSVLPLLVQHLNSTNYVTYTYAAITIDRILSIKQGNHLIFAQADIHEFAVNLVDALLTKIESAGTAEKVAENDYLMKCVMRVIITARQTFTPVYEPILTRLVAILGLISKNPSNPRFDQFIFESLSGLMRFVVGGNTTTLQTFENALFQPFTVILEQDVDQYIPYVFQVLAQMLELHQAQVPEQYRSLLPLLLTPAMWQQKGSIPGLVKLLKAFLARDSAQMLAGGQVASVLAVVQQRLIPSKLNDAWGFELLQAVVLHVKPDQLKQYFKAVVMTLLTRMQTSKTDQYVHLFTRFFLFTMAIQVDGLSPDYVIGTIEEIQAGLWSQILTNFVVPQVPKMPPKERKLTVVGVTRLLTESIFMTQQPSATAWPAAFGGLVKLFSEPQYLTGSKPDEDPHAGLTEVDFEEQTAGYQAAYSRLAASEVQEADPVDYVRDPQQFLGQELVQMSKRHGPTVKAMIQAAPGAGPFLQALISAGYVL
ncbi:hypothetical protein H0H93_002564 [Arthromyces matolae]|nr:hypothetical protein H0H93_002564 [Arthromyces matolae]